MVNMTPTRTLAEDFAHLWRHAGEVYEKTSKVRSITTPPYPFHGAGSRQFPLWFMWAAIVLIPIVPLLSLGLSFKWYLVSLPVLGLPTFAVFIFASSTFLAPPSQFTQLPGKPLSHYITFKDSEMAAKYAKPGSKIPMEELFEAYFDEKLDFNIDILEAFEARYDFASFQFTTGQLKFFLTQWVPETLWHSRTQDEDQVREHYDRGNDFYAAMLGERMVYTSGLVFDPDKRETLEQFQDNKLEHVSKIMQLKQGDRHLDIGCGWGTLLVHASKFHGTVSTGVTLAKEQIEFGSRRAAELGVHDRVRFLHMDYRDIPFTKYDKITCLEMAEHVGVRKFPAFLDQVYNMLEDDGLFFLQIAGLRRPWTYEDLIWGLFMARYVFPGADASMPLAWVINQLECAGFEVREVQTIGCHYSATIQRWYYNWLSNRDEMERKYGTRWVRVWEVFLAWSSIIARQGSATCYQIVAHKNLNKFERAGLVRGFDSATKGIYKTE